jgi:hypothetical protein
MSSKEAKRERLARLQAEAAKSRANAVTGECVQRSRHWGVLLSPRHLGCIWGRSSEQSMRNKRACCRGAALPGLWEGVCLPGAPGATPTGRTRRAEPASRRSCPQHCPAAHPGRGDGHEKQQAQRPGSAAKVASASQAAARRSLSYCPWWAPKPAACAAPAPAAVAASPVRSKPRPAVGLEGGTARHAAARDAAAPPAAPYATAPAAAAASLIPGSTAAGAAKAGCGCAEPRGSTDTHGCCTCSHSCCAACGGRLAVGARTAAGCAWLAPHVSAKARPARHASPAAEGCWTAGVESLPQGGLAMRLYGDVAHLGTERSAVARNYWASCLTSIATRNAAWPACAEPSQSLSSGGPSTCSRRRKRPGLAPRQQPLRRRPRRRPAPARRPAASGPAGSSARSGAAARCKGGRAGWTCCRRWRKRSKQPGSCCGPPRMSWK